MRAGISFVFLTVLAMRLIVKCSADDRVILEKRLIGGTEASLSDWPFIVYLNFHNKNPTWKIAQGVLIADNFVLTVASALEEIYKTPELVTVGANRITPSTKYEDGKNFTISKIIMHPEYVLPKDRSPPHNFSFDHDIAILKLSKSVKGRKEFATLPQQDEGVYSYSNQECKLASWGATLDYDNEEDFRALKYKVSKTLMEGRIPLVEKSQCLKEENLTSFNWGKIERLVCAGKPNKSEQSTTCFADHGGPLLCENDKGKLNLNGLCLTGNKFCKTYPHHIYFTEVAKYRSWIDKVMSEE